MNCAPLRSILSRQRLTKPPQLMWVMPFALWTRGFEDEHWPGNYLHAWTWASAWHPSGCGSRSPLSTPWGRRRRWCAPWCTSGQVRIPPPSRLFRLPVIKQNKQSRDRGDSGPSVTSHRPRSKQVTLLESIFDGQSPRLPSLCTGFPTDMFGEWPPLLIAWQWVPCLHRNGQQCELQILYRSHCVRGGLLNQPEMIVTYLCGGKRYGGVKRVNTSNPAPSWSSNAATTLKTLQRSPAETSCCKSLRDDAMLLWPHGHALPVAVDRREPLLSHHAHTPLFLLSSHLCMRQKKAKHGRYDGQRWRSVVD